MKKLRWMAVLMGITILGITGFQGYWLRNNYDREKQNLEIKTNVDFRETILKLQSYKLKLEKVNIQLDSLAMPAKANVVVRPGRKKGLPDSIFRKGKEMPITIMNLLEEKMREAGDSGISKAFIISGNEAFARKLYYDSLKRIHGGAFGSRMETLDITSDSLHDPGMIRQVQMNGEKSGDRMITINYGHKKGQKGKPDSVSINTSDGIFIEKHDQGIPPENLFEQKIPSEMQRNGIVRFLYNVDSLTLKDSVTIKEITNAYSAKLKENKMNSLSFAVSRLDSSHTNSQGPNEVTIGFAKPLVYRLSLENEMSYLLKRLTLPLLFSLFLVGITIVSFVVLYRNLVRQRRLAELKNDFISNITHELKTPIATVGVAIEALQNFNAIHDPQRTKEYLDISQNELQRLSLLVDKVLKLSMFEKKEIELKKEQFDCKQLAEEVMSSMRLQFEKYRAKVKLHTEGDNFMVEADKLHITSVIYNLLDNALKYSRENPVIDVRIISQPEFLEFSVHDNGIGIAPAYKEKIFDKFFRVPTGDKHNIKGYGLGLSYVSEVIKRHHGYVSVESEPGNGSTFTARFPYKEVPIARFDSKRSIRKRKFL
ncbi:MAG: HAMP domain-containing sensor histidine kinase [Bacteroidota bacterium]|nr:HAMP domain-containing sensor histidine kinase [Bacteroidota bacterium]